MTFSVIKLLTPCEDGHFVLTGVVLSISLVPFSNFFFLLNVPFSICTNGLPHFISVSKLLSMSF